jgi:hypothetical protein
LRQGIELLLGTAALVVSGISLWIAIGTEQANRQMVAAASWPLLQADTADLAENGHPVITFILMNGGVGPAKLKTLEISWRGRPFRGALPLLEICCGYKPFSGPADSHLVGRTPITTGGVHNVVILASEKRTFLSFPLTADNSDVWRKLDIARRELKFRACYCSVFDECWISNLADLEPTPVTACPAVKVPYVE